MCVGGVAEVDPDLLQDRVGVLLDDLEPFLGEHLERRERPGDVRDAIGRGGGPRGLATGAASGSPPRRVRRGRLRLVGIAHGVLLSFVSLARAGSRRRRRRSSPVAPPDALRCGQGHDRGQSRRRLGRVRDAHRTDEMLLEARLDRGLDLLDPADDVLDLRAGGAVQQRDPRPRARRVARGRHVLRVAVGHQPEDQRVHGVDVRAERAGQADAIDGLDPKVVHQEPAPGVERRLRQLDLPHVVLRDDQARRRRRAARRRTCARRGRPAASGPPARRR